MFKFSTKNKSKIVRSLPNARGNQRIISSKKPQHIANAGKSILIKILLRLLVISFVGVTIYILFFSPLLTIKSIHIDGAQNIDEQQILDIVNVDIAGKYLNIFLKSNIILAKQNNIETDLRNKFKRIADVEITKKFPETLLITIKEYDSALIFCSGEQCLVVDNSGRAYAQANFEANELGEHDLTILRDTSQKTINIADFLIDSGLVNFITDIKSKLKRELDIDIKQECQTSMLVSGDLKFETVNNYNLYFSYDIGADKSIEMLKTALNNSINKDSAADLEYIDLRLDNKVYYKLKTNPVVAAEAESVTAPVVAPVEKKK